MKEAPNMSVLQQDIHTSRYARWLPEEARRETWEETVDRYVDYFEKSDIFLQDLQYGL